jgi:hypothetical protein
MRNGWRTHSDFPRKVSKSSFRANPATGSPAHKKAPADRAGGLKGRITSGLSGRFCINRTAASIRFIGLNPMQPKPASASLDRVSLAPTADFWAVHQGPAVSVVLAGSAGFQVSAPSPVSADRYVVGCDFLDLTFLLLLCWSFLYR